MWVKNIVKRKINVGFKKSSYFMYSHYLAIKNGSVERAPPVLRQEFLDNGTFA
jgi:hypothetical protein